MSSNKRKTLQIKRPDPAAPGQNRPLPKVNVSPSAATPETDEIQPVAPSGNKGATTRIQLPDEAKIRKARRADETEDRLPGAEEVMQASKNATAQIEIDVEDVQTPQRSLKTDESGDSADKTMKISTIEFDDADASSTSRIPLSDLSKLDDEATQVVTGELPKVGGDEPAMAERTMKIDLDAFQTGDVGKALKQADRELDQGNDLTMKIDADAFQTGDLGKALSEADQDAGEANDLTMKIDASALEEEEEISRMRAQQMSTETMVMDSVEDQHAEKFNAATMAMSPPDNELEAVTPEKMKESFNAMTMAMDPSELAKALGNAKATQPEPEGLEDFQDEDARPKTILIRRPSRDADAVPSTPTVKTVRPDAQTVRTVRPEPSAAAAPAAPGEGKTVKLRRPGGATGSRPGAPASRVAAAAGLNIGADGSVTSSAPKRALSLGGGWLAVSIVTFFLYAGALWITYAVKDANLPMMGRIVDANNQFIATGN